MERDKFVKYWVDTAEKDYSTVQHMFQTGDYHWGLFIGHLVLEKLFKALYAKRNDDFPPRSHDLNFLAKKCGVEVNEQLFAKLEFINGFNLSTRYPDLQQKIYQQCTKEYSLDCLNTIEEIRLWLFQLIRV